MSVYLITGAAGYIGSMLAQELLKSQNEIRVVALVRDPEKLRRRFSDLCIYPCADGKRVGGQSDARRSGVCLEFFQAELSDSSFFPSFYEKVPQVDRILHCASITASSEMLMHPVEVTASIVNATQNVLELARHYKVDGMVYLSSMEVYGSVESPKEHRTVEEEAGDGKIDLLRERSSYPLAKRMAENICYSYYKEYGVPVKIARLAQTFGRGAPPADSRVFAQFARAAASGRDIVLHTEGRSMGNYCAIDDAVAGILTILERGKDGEAYNVVNEENTMTIRQMAELVAEQIAGGRIGVCYEIPREGIGRYAADTGLRLSGEKLRGLGWMPRKSLVEMYRELVEEFDCKMDRDSLY